MDSNTCVLDRVDSQKHFCNIFNDSVTVIPLELNTKFQENSLFNFFFHSKNHQTNFSPCKPMAAKHILIDVSRSNFTYYQKRCYQPRKKLFTVSVHARGLTGLVRVKFDQMVLFHKGFSNRDITISYLYMNTPLNFFNELSM